MSLNHFPFDKKFLLWLIFTGVLFSLVALAPQIDLWKIRGENYNGVYAVNEFDEPFYAAYVQSLIDNKPRRNSPYSGAEDSLETPQKESYLSIQYLSSYPIAIFAKLFGLSSSSAMILFSSVIGFVSAFAVFLLFYLITLDSFLSFVGTVTVLFGGTLVAGEGNIFILLSPDINHYGFSLYFLRRSVPAISFPVLFLFYSFVWIFLTTNFPKTKLFSGLAAICCFAFTVYSYFYHWTTAIAWVLSLIFIWVIFRREDLRQDAIYLVVFGVCLLLVLIPYFFLLSNRSTSTDSALFLVYTHQPDLWRVPEIVSYLVVAVICISNKYNWIKLRNKRILFLLSCSLIAPIVFNQQILTGRSLQPFHYQYTCVNYISLLSLLATIFILVKRTAPQDLKKLAILMLAGAFLLGCLETAYGVFSNREVNIARDKLSPVAQRINFLSRNPPSQTQTSVILSFDFIQGDYVNSIDLPSLSSQAVLWGPHITMFPDVDAENNKNRLFKSLYFQNFDVNRLKKEFEKRNWIILTGFFGGGRLLSSMTSEYKPITTEEINEIIDDYEEFCSNFNYETAQNPDISFVLIPEKSVSDFSNLDKWYQRDDGEVINEYRLYRIKLKKF